MTCSFFHDTMMTDIIIYGGNKRRESKFDRHVMTGLTILRFGVIQSRIKLVYHPGYIIKLVWLLPR